MVYHENKDIFATINKVIFILLTTINKTARNLPHVLAETSHSAAESF